MKKNNILNIAMTLTLGAAMTACSDVVNYEDSLTDNTSNNGAPVITAIYDVQDTAYANALSEGTLNQMLRITGKNLAQVKSVTFNGIEVDVRSVYATSTAAFVKIPRQIPESVDNKLVYTTPQGTLTYNFAVSIPSMECNGLANEFALPGSSVEMTGEYFDLFGFGQENSGASIVMSNPDSSYAKTLEIDSLTEEYMGVVIPDDAPQNSVITLTWTEPGNKQMTKRVPYRYSKYLLFDDLRNVAWWDSATLNYITDGNADGDPESLGWPFFRIKGSFAQWSWNSFGGGGNWPDIDCTANPADYAFKFEVCNASSYPFYESGDFGYMFSLNNSANYVWNPSSGISFNTYGQWQTISIPLDKVTTNGVAAANAWSNFILVMQPNADGGWNIDHSFANFRVEPKDF